MYCARCGLRLPEDARFCAKCGRALTAEARLSVRLDSRSKKPRKVVGLILGFLSLLVILGFLLFAIPLLHEEHQDNRPNQQAGGIPTAGSEASSHERSNFAVQLSLSFKQNGLDMVAYTDEDTLEVKSDLFKDIGTREQFLQGFLNDRNYNKRLCSLGFRQVYAYYSKGALSGNVGRSVSIGCP